VAILQAGLPENKGSIPGGGINISVHHASIPAVGPLNHLSNGQRGVISPVSKLSGHETDISPPSSTEITNA
jgi:hypothetical protein